VRQLFVSLLVLGMLAPVVRAEGPAPEPRPKPRAPASDAAKAEPKAARKADDAAPETERPLADKVTIAVQVVHATDSQEGIDPRLEALARSFRYFKYKGYRLLSSDKQAMVPGGNATFAIAGERRLTVTVVERDAARARVRVEIVKDDNRLLDTTVSINRDGTFIVAGPKFGDGILMLPLRATY
jgi:hypothetical protein